MKSKTIVCAIALATLSFGSLSFAQGYDRRHGGDQPRVEHQSRVDRGSMHRDNDNNHRDNNNNRDFNRDRDGRNYGARNFDHRDGRNDRQYGAYGHQYHRGGYVPVEYRHRNHAYNNWRAQRLSQPAYGQQWVQVGADYALIAIATGVIAQLVLGNY